ncbi:hypothetical protein KP509_09G013100 [Ceratopteris richardii]|uniref:Uncharacterized protein n=1 Tax=Ceratopteris richardii TaxID=49495 RepID=A0A8T2U4N6_CERRI|nr:hypothetical protein KP509_09G013100 [Ceratopteris richardii]
MIFILAAIMMAVTEAQEHTPAQPPLGEQRRSCWLCRFIIPHRLCLPGLPCFHLPLESPCALHDLPLLLIYPAISSRLIFL